MWENFTIRECGEKCNLYAGVRVKDSDRGHDDSLLWSISGCGRIDALLVLQEVLLPLPAAPCMSPPPTSASNATPLLLVLVYLPGDFFKVLITQKTLGIFP